MSFTPYLDGRKRFEDHVICFKNLLMDNDIDIYPAGTARDVSPGVRIYYVAEWAQPPQRIEDGREEHGIITFTLTIAGRSQDPVDDIQTALRSLKDTIWAIYKNRVVDIHEYPWEADEDEVVLPVEVSIWF